MFGIFMSHLTLLAQAPAPAPAPAPPPPAEKAPKKTAAKAAVTKGKAVQVEKQEPLDPVAEKLRQQRLIIICLLVL